MIFSDTGTITGVWNSTLGTLTLTGGDTLANYEAALRSITYQNTSDTPSDLTRTVSFTVNDGDVDSNVLTRDIDVTPANDAPMIDLNGSDGGGFNYSTMFNEGDSPVSVTDSDATITDLDHVVYQRLDIGLSGFLDGPVEEIIIAGNQFQYGNVRNKSTYGWFDKLQHQL